MARNKKIQAQETISDEKAELRLLEITNEIEDLRFKYERAQESLLSLDMILDNRGWQELFGNNVDLWGPSIEQIRYASTQIRELTTVNAHMKRGNLLRANYCWNGGIHYAGIDGAKQGPGTNVQARIDDPVNQREFFGPAARKKRSKAEYCDGHAIYIGDDSSHQLKFVDFQHVQAVLANPADPSEIWAMRITVDVSTDINATDLQARWIFLDEFVDKRVAKIYIHNGVEEQIDQTHRVFLRKVNETPGWQFGVPDALAAMGWIRMYREYIISGKKMSDAMAMLWGQYKSTAAGMANASVAVGGQKQGAGQVDVSGGEWNILSTAGKSYDFEPGMAILAAAATSLEISVIDLSSNPGAAGSSYGSAQTLDLPSRIAVAARRAEEAEFDEKVLRWMGAKDPKAWFDSLQSAEDIYRLMQAEGFYWAYGLRDGMEQKKAMDTVKGIPNEITPQTPEGLMLPNNEKFVDTLSNDANLGNGSGGGASTTPTTGTPGQGKSTGAGGAGNTGNVRKDKISK